MTKVNRKEMPALGERIYQRAEGRERVEGVFQHSSEPSLSSLSLKKILGRPKKKEEEKDKLKRELRRENRGLFLRRLLLQTYTCTLHRHNKREKPKAIHHPPLTSGG